MPARAKVLFVFTSCDQTLSGASTGWYLPEAAHPYYTLSPHADITFAAPKGPFPPIDHTSVEKFTDAQSQSFIKDANVKQKLENCQRLEDVRASEYDAVYYVGGYGPVVDLAVDPANVRLAADFWNSGKVVSAICHGVAALVGVKDDSGSSIFRGREVTAFSNAEEVLLGKTHDLPFFLETRIRELGGIYVRAEPRQEKIVVSGNLITGQNPASADALGKAILAKLTA